jgi:hypothetical protein
MRPRGTFLYIASASLTHISIYCATHPPDSTTTETIINNRVAQAATSNDKAFAHGVYLHTGSIVRTRHGDVTCW